ncbi:hypothetical protein C8Q73DRAFT_719321 [Cubamyces lactineus]|nr:hypothetical protein C8Q73DRAFT_719321 [Cubamyces lactineus]
MALNLPKELVDHITDLVHYSDPDDWRTLTACALFHPLWADRALTHISSAGITLKVDWPDCPDFVDFTRTVLVPSFPSAATATPVDHVSAAIHQLTISSPVSSTTPTADDLFPLSEPIPFEHLPNLRALKLRYITIPDISSLVTVLEHCNTLEELYLQGLALEVTATTTSGNALDAARIGRCGRPVLPSLQTLRLLDFIDPFSQLISLAIAHIVHHTTPASLIRSLGLHPTSLCTTGDRDLLGWYEAITHISNTLTRLSLTVAISLDRFPEYSDCTRFPTAIVRSEHLRHFALRYHPALHSSYWGQPEFFLSSVRRMFTYSPPRFSRVLESFVIATPYKPPPYTPDSIVEELTQLVEVLLNTENYPALSMFHLCITTPTTLATDPTALDDPSPLSGAQETGTWVEAIAAVMEPLRDRDIEVATRAMRMNEWDARYG